MHPNCTYTVISGCKYRDIVPKLHPNLNETSEGDEIMVSWKGNGRLMTNLEARKAKKQDGRPKNRSVRQAEDILCKSIFYSKYSGAAPIERAGDAITTF